MVQLLMNSASSPAHMTLNPDESGKMVKIRVPHKETPVISKI